MKKIVITKELCANFNKFRAEHYQTVFTANQMTNILRGFGFKGSNYLTIAKRLGIVIQVKKGKYTLSPTPVHIKKLENLLEGSRALVRKSVNKKALEKSTPEKKAIQLLKDLGYKVSKPQFDIELALKCPDSPVKHFVKWVIL